MFVRHIANTESPLRGGSGQVLPLRPLHGRLQGGSPEVLGRAVHAGPRGRAARAGVREHCNCRTPFCQSPVGLRTCSTVGRALHRQLCCWLCFCPPAFVTQLSLFVTQFVSRRLTLPSCRLPSRRPARWSRSRRPTSTSPRIGGNHLSNTCCVTHAQRTTRS